MEGLTKEEQEVYRNGLRIIARMIARHHLSVMAERAAEQAEQEASAGSSRDDGGSK